MHFVGHRQDPGFYLKCDEEVIMVLRGLNLYFRRVIMSAMCRIDDRDSGVERPWSAGDCSDSTSILLSKVIIICS